MKGVEHRGEQPQPEPENRERRALLGKGVRYTIGTGLLAYGFTEAFTVSRKKVESQRRAVANVEAQGIKAPDNTTLSQANLKREPSKGLVRVDSNQPITQQERNAVAEQAIYDWSYKNEYNNDPEAPAAFREYAAITGVGVGGWIDGHGAIDLIDTVKGKVVSWAERRNAAKAQGKDQ
jgi:hypothetical protein